MVTQDSTLERLLDFANCVSDTPLTNLSDELAYEALVTLLHSSQLAINEQIDEQYRIEIANYLIQMDKPVVKPLLDYLIYEPHQTQFRVIDKHKINNEHNRNRSRNAVAELLGKHEDESVVPGLLDALNTIRNLQVLKSIIYALMQSGDSNAIAALTEILLSHQRTFLRKSIAEMMGYFPQHRTELSLVLVIKDKSIDVAIAALESLRKIQSKSTLPFLVELLINFPYPGSRTKDTTYVSSLLDAIQSFDTEETRQIIFDWCVDTIQNNNTYMRRLAAKRIASLHDNRAIPYLLDILNIQMPFLSSLLKVAKDALIEIGTAEALAALEDWQQKQI